MPNSIALISKYVSLLDEVYKYSSRSAILDNPNVQFIGGNAVKVFKTAMDGLGDYSRNNGYVNGNVNGSWETMTLEQDRGRSFMIDAMDNEETLGQAFGTLTGEFLRTMVVPEIDAYRFAKYATNAGTTVSKDLVVGTDDVGALIDTAEQVMGDAEVPEEGRILFVSETCYNALKAKTTRYLANENGVNKEIVTFNNMPVIRIPSGRFATAITLYDGSSVGETAGGYVQTTGGYLINFMIVHPSAVVQTVKHALPRIFDPTVNQIANAWKFDYRIYHDAFVEANKTKGIYLHKKATAI